MLILFVIVGALGVGAGVVAWQSDTPGDPTVPTPGTDAEAPDCEKLLAYVTQHGAAGGRALWLREIQHRGGQEGFASGGWMGAIMGAISGTGEAGKALKACETALGDRLKAADATHDAGRAAIKDTKKACKQKCDEDFPLHGLGPRGKPWRECKKACRKAAQASRREMRGPGGSSASQWFRTFLP